VLFWVRSVTFEPDLLAADVTEDGCHRCAVVKSGLLLIALLLLLPGCVPGTSPLPTARANLHFASIDLPRAAYCWHSGAHGECADSPGPETLLRMGDLKPFATAGGYDIQIVFNPTSQVTSFTVELAYGPGSPSPIATTAPQTFALPQVSVDKAGVYVYAVSGAWPEGDVTFFLALNLVPGVA